MGAWGTGAFENDAALDWLFELEKAKDLTCVWQATEAVFGADYLDSDVASEALVAIELAAGLKGKPNQELPEEVETWLNNNTQQLPSNYYVRAVAALDVICGEESELKELWAESESYTDWMAEINDLKIRLGSTRGAFRKL